MTDNPFGILSSDGIGAEAQVDANIADINERIKALIGTSDLFLFMKGNTQMPQCGFSANTIGILQDLGKSFSTFDILSDPSIREGVKQFSNWPTYPQLYYKGQLVGGNDVITEMHESGDLKTLINN